jgi:hypothetical protein
VVGSTLVVDDHLLVRILLGDEPTDLRLPGTAVFTTGLWYHRLCRALCDRAFVGALSRALGPVDRATGAGVASAVIRLPESVGLRSMRELAWPMAQLLDDGHRLNLLSLEALAAAEELRAEICLTALDANPPLAAAAATRGVAVRLVDA